jgi:TonB family protein
LAALASVLLPVAPAASSAQEAEKPAAETQQKAARVAPHRIRVAGNVMAAKLVQKVDPEYPKEARKKHLQGDVRLRILVDEQGNVAKTHALSENHVLAKAAAEAVRQWRYQTTLLNGGPVQVESEVELHFHRHKWRVD